MILLGVEKLREILSFCSVVMSFMLLQNIAPEKMGGFPRLVFDVSTRCWYKLFVFPGLLEVLEKEQQGITYMSHKRI